MKKTMKLSAMAQLLSATDAKTVEARKNDNYKNLSLLPRDLWEWKLMKIGGCKLPRRKRKQRILLKFFSRSGMPFKFPSFNEQSSNFEEVVNNLPLNKTGKSRLVDSFVNPNKP